MGVGLGLTLGGAAAVIGGSILSSNSASKKRRELERNYKRWLPDIGRYQRDWFSDMEAFAPRANTLAEQQAQAARTLAWNQREQDLPGYRQAVTDSFSAISPLLRGELPPSVLANFQRAGGASTVGLGMGGSNFGALNTGLFGARGSLGAMQTGQGLLGGLLSSLPTYQSPSAMNFLSQLMTPLQRTQTQLNVRGQNLGIASQLAQMDTSSDVLGQGLSSLGGMLMGGGIGGMGGMGGGGGASGLAGAGQISSLGYQVPSNYFGLSQGMQSQYTGGIQRAYDVNRTLGPGYFE